MINISTGLRQALQTTAEDFSVKKIGNDISFGDGDGAGGTDTINATTTDLSVFTKHAFVKVIDPGGGANDNKLVKVISSSATKLEVPAGSFSTQASGTYFGLVTFDVGGCFRNIFKNGTIKIFAESRPTNADSAEPGSSICDITLNGNAFTPGIPENGLNFGELDGVYLRRAIDPETAASEIWRGLPSVTANANSARFYANDVVIGASVSAVRFDCTVTGLTGGGDMRLTNGTGLTAGVAVDVALVSMVMNASAVS